jgi:hypothetical protein
MTDATIMFKNDGSGIITAPDGSKFHFPSGISPTDLAATVERLEVSHALPVTPPLVATDLHAEFDRMFAYFNARGFPVV